MSNKKRLKARIDKLEERIDCGIRSLGNVLAVIIENQLANQPTWQPPETAPKDGKIILGAFRYQPGTFSGETERTYVDEVFWVDTKLPEYKGWRREEDYGTVESSVELYAWMFSAGPPDPPKDQTPEASLGPEGDVILK